MFPSSLPKWQRIRARRLHRICQSLDRRKDSAGFLKSVRRFAAWWKLHHPQARFSTSTLIRSYYHWLENGKCEAAFKLRYRGTGCKVTPERLANLVKVCADPAIQSLGAAYRALPEPHGTADAYRYALGKERRKQLSRLFELRRKAESNRRQAWKILGEVQKWLFDRISSSPPKSFNGGLNSLPAPWRNRISPDSTSCLPRQTNRVAGKFAFWKNPANFIPATNPQTQN